MNGWILLHKKIWESENWKLSKNRGNIMLVWIWLLTHCNEIGVVTFGRKQIAEDTGIYESSVKRAIEHIRDEMTSEVTYEPTSTYSKITILNWLLYQRKVTNQPTSNRPASDQQVTTNKELKNERIKETIHTQEILDFYNTTFNKTLKTTVFDQNLSYWLTVYSLDEVKNAILAAKQHRFWKDVATPEKLFRRKNQNGEKVDHIGDLLSQEVKPKSLIGNYK